MPTTDLDRCLGRLSGKLRRTARRWPVLPEGGKLLLAVSGGLDSLAMAYLVIEHGRRMKRPMQLSAVHVRLDADGRTDGLPDEIRRWFDSLRLEWLEVDARLDGSEQLPLDCFACSRARRRTLLESADARGATHVALGHHADDVVETWLLSLMYTGSPETIPAVRSYFDGAVTVVRPMFELQRGELRRLAKLADFPQPVERCRREDEARREKVRAALAVMGKDQRLVRRQLYWAAARGLSGTETETGTETGQKIEEA